ncbi:unnamed protein product [Absidia cylindrospora]
MTTKSLSFQINLLKKMMVSPYCYYYYYYYLKYYTKTHYFPLCVYVVDEELANYMMNLRHFEAPGSPGTVEQEKQDKEDKDYTMVTFSTGDSMLSEEEFYVEQSLPMYHFPESDEIVDYLSTMQEQLVRKNALEDSTNSTLGRTRRRKATAATSTNQQEPRTASTSTSSSPYTAISKYQKRHQLGLYRHRWNK